MAGVPRGRAAQSGVVGLRFLLPSATRNHQSAPPVSFEKRRPALQSWAPMQILSLRGEAPLHYLPRSQGLGMWDGAAF